jgi:hypothetical protein
MASADDFTTAITRLMMGTPAISADGKTIALYSFAPGREPDAKTSLVIFNGTRERERLGIVPSGIDAARARTSAASATRKIDGMKRMARVAKGEETWGPKYEVALTSSGTELHLSIVDRRVTVTAKRDGRDARAEVALAAKDGGCRDVKGYSISNTMAGFDDKTGLFAFSVEVEDKTGTTCFAHDFVVQL